MWQYISLLVATVFVILLTVHQVDEGRCKAKPGEKTKNGALFFSIQSTAKPCHKQSTPSFLTRMPICCCCCCCCCYCCCRSSSGYRGVYWRGGALLSAVTRPGFHMKMPFITTMSQVQVTVQTDSVTNIPCGTSGGVLINFGKIESHGYEGHGYESHGYVSNGHFLLYS